MIIGHRSRKQTLVHSLMADFNIMDERKKLLSYPLRKAGSRLLEGMDKGSNFGETITSLMLAAYAAAPVFMGNVLFPAKLIGMGFRPHPVFEGVSFARNSPFVKPLFNYFHAASPAFKAGAKVGGKFGGRVGARLIPGVGYGLLAYDAYDIVANRSLWGFDFD